MIASRRLGFSLSVPLLLFSCAKTGTVVEPFSPNWQNDSGQSIAAVERRLRGVPAAPSVNVAVGVTKTELVGLTLDDKSRWTHPAHPDTLPAIATDLVIYSEKGRVVALDAVSGVQRWSVDSDGYQLRGAGDDGTTSVLSLGRPTERKSALLMVGRDGSVRARVESATELGRPAGLGGVAFVPWSGQYVSALEMDTGKEAGRLLTRELTSHALAVGGALFFGEKSLLHFDEHIRFASTNQTERAALPNRELPGKPVWLQPGTELPSLTGGARQRVRIYAAPAWESGVTGFASNRFAATYFRALLGFDAKTAELVWTRASDSSIVGGAAARSGFVLCASSGKLLRVGANGGDAGVVAFGTELEACSVEASTMNVPNGAPPGPLTEQISRTLVELDPQMAAAQAFLVTELGRSETPAVTQTLIDLSTSSRLPPDVRLRARALLATRRTGAEFMLVALGRRFDFLSSDVLPVPVGPLADALAAMKETRAAPLLARHLNDPSTEATDVEHAARALQTLARTEELPELTTFFALYRGTADEPPLINAVIAVAAALLRLGGTDGRATLARAARDPLTEPEIARGLNGLLANPVVNTVSRATNEPSPVPASKSPPLQ